MQKNMYDITRVQSVCVCAYSTCIHMYTHVCIYVYILYMQVCNDVCVCTCTYKYMCRCCFTQSPFEMFIIIIHMSTVSQELINLVIK